MSDEHPTIGEVASDPASAEHIAKQQAEFEASQQPDPNATPAPCDTSPEGIHSRGGYMLMDPQWVAGGPWNGIPAEEQQGEQNRRHDIVQQMKAGTAFGFTEEGLSGPDELDPFATDLAGWFPASKAGRTNLEARTGDARVEYAIATGNQLARCEADHTFYVEM